jgi:NAD(P)-dependent dehydrogenase (short-subunit alcohol dehydrogenase family)
MTAPDGTTAPTGRATVVTGGSRGIGLATVNQLLLRGDRVAVLSRSGQAPVGALGIACDVRRGEDVEHAMELAAKTHGPTEVLISNAGITNDGLIMRMSEEAFTDVMDANVTAAYRLIKCAAGPMIRARFGRIVLVSSAVAFAGAPGQANYAASKAALVGLARAVARELGPRNVTCNVIAPGLIETDMIVDLTENRRAQVLGAIPLGRLGRPDEVASAISYLASDQAAYINGAILAVDGGVAMGL